MSLTSKQVRTLRAETHRLKLKPVVLIGQNGLSESVMAELEQAVHHHELLKIRVPGMDKKNKKQLIGEINARLNTELIQVIGHTAVIYRENPDKGRFRKLLG